MVSCVASCVVSCVVNCVVSCVVSCVVNCVVSCVVNCVVRCVVSYLGRTVLLYITAIQMNRTFFIRVELCYASTRPSQHSYLSLPRTSAYSMRQMLQLHVPTLRTCFQWEQNAS